MVRMLAALIVVSYVSVALAQGPAVQGSVGVGLGLPSMLVVTIDDAIAPGIGVRVDAGVYVLLFELGVEGGAKAIFDLEDGFYAGTGARFASTVLVIPGASASWLGADAVAGWATTDGAVQFFGEVGASAGLKVAGDPGFPTLRVRPVATLGVRFPF